MAFKDSKRRDALAVSVRGFGIELAGATPIAVTGIDEVHSHLPFGLRLQLFRHPSIIHIGLPQEIFGRLVFPESRS